MKKISLLILLTGCLLLPSISAVAGLQQQLDLMACLANNDCQRSSANNNDQGAIKPIQAFITGQNVVMQSNVSLGMTQMSIYDEMGSIVYQEPVKLDAGQQLFIDTFDFNSGSYTVEFVNTKNESVSIDFDKQ